jgi:hypothetical protein
MLAGGLVGGVGLFALVSLWMPRGWMHPGCRLLG